MSKTRKLLSPIIIIALATIILIVAINARHNSLAPKTVNQNITLKHVNIIYVALSPNDELARLPGIRASIKLRPGAEERILRALGRLGNNVIVLIDTRNITSAVDSARHVFIAVASKRIPIVLVGTPASIKEIIDNHARAYPLPLYIVARGTSRPSYNEVKLVILSYVPPNNQRTWSMFILSIVSSEDELLHVLRSVANKTLQYLRMSINQPKLWNRLYLPGTNILAQIDIDYSCAPYGSLNIRDVLYEISSNDSRYLWLIYRFIDMVVPGEKRWQSGWLNKVFIQELEVKRYDLSGFLSYYAPSTLLDNSTSIVKVAFASPTSSTSSGYNWSYMKQGVTIIDESDYGAGVAKWRNIVNVHLAGLKPIQLEPGALVRYPRSGEHVLAAKYLAKWAKRDCKLLGHLCSWKPSDYCGLVVVWVIKSP